MREKKINKKERRRERKAAGMLTIEGVLSKMQPWQDFGVSFFILGVKVFSDLILCVSFFFFFFFFGVR